MNVGNNLVHNLWKNHANLNDVNSKRSSSRCFQGHNVDPRVMGSVHSFSHIFFSLRIYIFFNFPNLKGINCTPKLCTYTKNVGHRVRSRATSLPGLLIEKQYRVLGMRARLFA